MTRRGIDIEGREKIVPEVGPAPMLQWLPLDSLVIDDRYQRQLNLTSWKSIVKIATNFRWSRFSPVLVAPIEGGMFAIIDGQHRSHAAALCGIAEVPAMVVQVGLEEQSRAFSWINSQSIRVSSFHVFKAALAAKEDWAVRADKAVSAAGCQLMTYTASTALKKPRQIYCVNLIKVQVDLGNDEAIRLGLTAITCVPSMAERTVCYTDLLLKSWLPAVADTGCTDVSVLAAALSRQNPFKLIDGLNKSQARAALRTAIDREVPL